MFVRVLDQVVQERRQGRKVHESMSLGANDVGNAIGPLLSKYPDKGLWLALLGGVAMAVGAWTFGERVTESPRHERAEHAVIVELIADLAPSATIDRLPEPTWEDIGGVRIRRIDLSPFEQSAVAKIRIAAYDAVSQPDPVTGAHSDGEDSAKS